MQSFPEAILIATLQLDQKSSVGPVGAFGRKVCSPCNCMMPRRLRTTDRIIAVTIGIGVAAAQVISSVVGWQAMTSPFERWANAAAAPIAGAVASALWLLIVQFAVLLRRLVTLSPAQLQQAIDSARTSGLLPDGYAEDPKLDMLITRTITFDRKAGLSEEEIRKDLAELLASDQA